MSTGTRLLAAAKADPEGVAYTVTVFEVATRSVVFSHTTASLGTVFDAKWCAVLPPVQFRASGGVKAPSGPGGSFALATQKGIVFFAPTPGGGTSYEPRKGVAGPKARGVEALPTLCALDQPEVTDC